MEAPGSLPRQQGCPLPSLGHRWSPPPQMLLSPGATGRRIQQLSRGVAGALLAGRTRACGFWETL